MNVQRVLPLPLSSAYTVWVSMSQAKTLPAAMMGWLPGGSGSGAPALTPVDPNAGNIAPVTGDDGVDRYGEDADRYEGLNFFGAAADKENH